MLYQILESLLCARRLKHVGRLNLLPRAGGDAVRAAARLADDLLPVRPRTVFDGGFHDGAFSHTLAAIYPEIEVCACDPFERREDWQFQPRRFFNVALGTKTGQAAMRLVNDPQLHSLLPLNPLQAKAYGPVYEQSVETKMVEVRPFDALLREAGWMGCDLLKLDVQGSELDALRGAEDMLSQVRAVYLEVSFEPLYEGQPLFYEIAEFLGAQGFKLAKIVNGRGLTYLLQADALFLNTRFYPASPA